MIMLLTQSTSFRTNYKGFWGLIVLLTCYRIRRLGVMQDQISLDIFLREDIKIEPMHYTLVESTYSSSHPIALSTIYIVDGMHNILIASLVTNSNLRFGHT